MDVYKGSQNKLPKNRVCQEDKSKQYLSNREGCETEGFSMHDFDELTSRERKSNPLSGSLDSETNPFITQKNLNNDLRYFRSD